jgi:iron complex outermembrane receptor protein
LAARILASTSLLCFAAAHAGATDAQTPPLKNDATGQDEASIIVTGARDNVLSSETPTGSRLDLTPLQIPAAVNVVDGDDIRARGDFDFVQAVSRAPGVTPGGTPGDGNTSLAMRGFGGQGSVMQLFNGVRLFPVAGTITFPFDTWNVERIEVLNGPGSVLYGQGALGGVVNVIPKSPNFGRFEAQAEAGYGSFDTYHVAAGLGGPIGEVVGYRLDASYRKSDGYVDHGESESLAISGAIEMRPSEDLSIVVRHDFGDTEPMKYWGTPVAGGERLDTSIREKNYNVADAVIDWRDNRTQLSVDWIPAPGLRVLNTAYRLDSQRRWENLETYELDMVAGQVRRSGNFGIDHDVEQYGDQGSVSYTAELGGGLSNQLLAGFDVNHVDVKYGHNFDTAPQEDAVDPIEFDPGNFLATVAIKPRYRTRTDTWALYLEDRFSIGEQFSVIGGIRYEEDTVARYNFEYDANDTFILRETPAFVGGTEPEKTFKDFTWRLGAVYQPTPTLSFYGQYVTGVDPVGTLTTFTTGGLQYAFSNSEGYMYEAGAKTTFLDGAGWATLSVYRVIKNDLSVQRVTNGPIEQIGQQSSQGIEASVSLDLPAGFGIEANGTILDAEFEDYPLPNDPDGYSGNTPPGVPETAANLSLRWAAQDRLQLRGSLRYVGRRFSDNANALRIPSYVVVDASATYALTDNVALDLRVYNLFDKDYALDTYGSQQWVLGRPRAFDVALRTSF